MEEPLNKLGGDEEKGGESRPPESPKRHKGNQSKGKGKEPSTHLERRDGVLKKKKTTTGGVYVEGGGKGVSARFINKPRGERKMASGMRGGVD